MSGTRDLRKLMQTMDEKLGQANLKEDATASDVEALVIPTEQVKEMLGGEWPDNGFAYGRVDHFKIADGRIIPMDGSSPLPAPDFKIVVAQ